MTALTHQLASRTLAAAAFMAAVVLGLIAALILGITATSGHPAGGPSGRTTPGSQPVPGPGSRALMLGAAATSGHPAGGPSGRTTPGSQPVPGPGFRQPGCLICAR
jgi:hypothetical protein